MYERHEVPSEPFHVFDGKTTQWEMYPTNDLVLGIIEQSYRLAIRLKMIQHRMGEWNGRTGNRVLRSVQLRKIDSGALRYPVESGIPSEIRPQYSFVTRLSRSAKLSSLRTRTRRYKPVAKYPIVFSIVG
jgi:hypothetical protein